MKYSTYIKSLITGITISLSCSMCPAFTTEPTPNGQPQTFSFKDGGQGLGDFLLNGKSFQIRSAEIHPQRVPVEYWRHRIQMAKAMGLNTIASYIFWNALEQKDGTFDYSDRNNIALWLKICAEEKMWVLFRPGPYVCGEWDFGGLPVYLLKDPKAGIRTMKDANFLKAQDRYLKEMAKLAKPFLCKNGGPILMTQIENEYGSFYRREREYLLYLKDFWEKEGFGPFYQSDGAGDGFLRGLTIKGVAVGLDPGESDGAFEAARRNNPGAPVFSSETYPGWLRHWGEGNWRPTDKTNNIKWFMEKKRSFNIFVFHGGTNFGFTAGANHAGNKGNYTADLTSYDYGSPCDEQGSPTKEYHKYKAKIAEYIPSVKDLPIPEAIPAMEIEPFTPKFFAPLRNNCKKPIKLITATYFEALDQNQGLAFYKTKIPAGPEATFEFEHLNDYSQVFVDGKYLTTVDRRNGTKSIKIPAREKDTTLEILVEGMGHINFRTEMETDRKGLFGKVKFNGQELKYWTFTPKPLEEAEVCKTAKPAPKDAFMGGHYRASFTLNKQVADTFFDMSKWKKGTLYVNGHNLGRYWNIGPQLRLYCPASYLKKGKNIIDIIEQCEMPEAMPIRGYKTRNYNMDAKKTANNNNAW